VERRVPPGKHEVSPGIALDVSTMGGYSVMRGNEYLGWIHASVGDQWNAYVRKPGTTGDHLGRFKQDDAVKVIVEAWDEEAVLPNGRR
jgi:hypothetical protein